MAKVEILSTPGCAACEVVKKMLDEMNVKYEVIDVTQRPEMLEKYPVMTAPGIVIDGKLEFSGVPDREELKKKIFK